MSPVPASRAAIQRSRIQERRASVRQKVPICGEISLSSGRDTFSVAVLDISEKGALIETSPPTVLNPNVELKLVLAGPDDAVHATGFVAWSGNSSRAGICFSSLRCAGTQSLEDWLLHNFLSALNSLPRQRNHLGPSYPQALFPEPNSTTTAWWDGPIEAGNCNSLLPIVEGALRLTHSTGAAIAWAHGEEIVCIATAGPSAPPVGTQLQAGSGLSGECFRTARTIRCDDSELDDRVNRESCHVLGIRSVVAVPIVSGNQTYGLLEVFASEPNHFSSHDQRILEKFAEIIAFPSTDSSGTIVTSEQLRAERAPHSPALRMIIRGNAKAVGVSLASLLPGLRYEPGFAHWLPRRSAKAITPVVLAAVGALMWLGWNWIQSAHARLRPAVSQILWRSSGPELNPYNDSFSIPLNATGLSGFNARPEQGDAGGAQLALGGRYAIAGETPQRNRETVLWLSRAAEEGDVTAQSVLSSSYESGIGVPQDLVKAYFWAAVAAAGGDLSSKDRIVFLNSQMSRAQVLDAQQQFGVWLRQHSAGVKSASP